MEACHACELFVERRMLGRWSASSMGIVNLSNIALKRNVFLRNLTPMQLLPTLNKCGLCLTKAAPVTRLSTIDRGRFQKAALTEK